MATAAAAAKEGGEEPREPMLMVSGRKGKLRLMTISLDGLLDYDVSDKYESTFEVSLFAELFAEMLQRDYGLRVARVLEEARDQTAPLPATLSAPTAPTAHTAPASERGAASGDSSAQEAQPPVTEPASELLQPRTPPEDEALPSEQQPQADETSAEAPSAKKPRVDSVPSEVRRLTFFF
jgi:hypothetical protein